MIRSLRRDDLTWIAALERRAFPDPWTPEALAGELEAPHALSLVGCLRPGRPGAYLLSRVLYEEAHLLKLAVLEEARQQGLGRTLLAAYEERALHRGAVWSVLEVREGNAPALRLYASQGYERIVTKPYYYPDGESAVLMGKVLRGPGDLGPPSPGPKREDAEP